MQLTTKNAQHLKKNCIHTNTKELFRGLRLMKIFNNTRRNICQPSGILP